MKKTLLLSLSILSLKSFALSPDKAEEIKWAPTNISPLLLTNIVEYKYCNGDLNRFKGCVAAVDRFIKFNDETSALAVENDQFVLTKDDTFKSRRENYKNYILLKRKNLDHIAELKSDALTKSLIALFQKEFAKKGKVLPHESMLPVNEFNAVAYDPYQMYEPVFKYNGLNQMTLPPGIGIELSNYQNQVLVKKVYIESEAEKAGLKVNDLILSIDGKAIPDVDLDTIDSLFNFKNNQIVTLGIRRGNEELTLNAKFAYQKYPPVVDRKIKLANQTLTYLNMSEIPSELDPEMTCKVFKNILGKFNKESAGMVLDLRDNLGGYGDVAACISSYFLGPKKHLYTEFDLMNNELDKMISSSPKVFTKPLVVLVNEGTASSGEILAGTLRFHGRAYLVGNRTYGKGIGQITDGYASLKNEMDKIELHSTSLFIRYPDGKTHQNIGLIPDVTYYLGGMTKSMAESDILRMEDYAVYPLKFEPSAKLMDRAELPKLKPSCTDSSKIEERLKGINSSSWENDPQLQMALSVLECSMSKIK